MHAEPGIDASTFKIPVVDVSSATAETGDQLVEAVARFGFVFVRGQDLGFTAQILDDTFELVRLKINVS